MKLLAPAFFLIAFVAALCAGVQGMGLPPLAQQPAGEAKQENRAASIEEKVLAMLNQTRVAAGLPPLTADRRLQDTATMHASESVKNERIARQFEGEPSLMERLRMAEIPCASAGEVLLMVTDLEHVPKQLSQDDWARQTLLNPSFSVAGVAVLRGGSQLFIVADLARPLKELTNEEVESLITEQVQQARTDKKLPPLKVVHIQELRELSCSMAKKDSLKVSPGDPDAGSIGAPRGYARTFVYTSLDPGNLPESVRAAADSHPNTMSLGACFGNSPTYPNGAYWIYLLLYTKTK